MPGSSLCLEGRAALASASSNLRARDTALQAVFRSIVPMHLPVAQEAAEQMLQPWPVAVRGNVPQELQCSGEFMSCVS